MVKPFNANHGRGISIHLTEPDQVRGAFAMAREHSRSVIVETFVDGVEISIEGLVVNDELTVFALTDKLHTGHPTTGSRTCCRAGLPRSGRSVRATTPSAL